MLKKNGTDMECEKESEFLAAVARKLGRERGQAPTPPFFARTPLKTLPPVHDQEALVHQFMQNLQQLDTAVWRVKRDQLAGLLGELVQKHGIQSFVCWEDERLQDLGLPEILSALSLKDQEIEPEKADVGITMADLGIAETGTLVLFNGGKKRRTTSLLPPVYISILFTSNIVPRITQALAKIGEMYRSSGDLPACINLITGPSRSADIEMSLSLGVHGPGRVYAVLLDD